jgi:hypothetical protein
LFRMVGGLPSCFRSSLKYKQGRDVLVGWNGGEVAGGIWRCGLGEKEPRKERGGNVHYDAVRSFSYHVDTFVVGRNVEMLHDGFALIFLALQLPFVRP